MNTKQAHAGIWGKVREFDGEAVLYAFRFCNGRTKFGKSANICSRAGDHLANGVTGCTGVTIVRVALEKLHAAERAMLDHVAKTYEQHASEVFASSDSEATDERLIREAIGEAATGEAPTVAIARTPVLSALKPDPVRDAEKRMRDAWAAEHRVRNPVASKSDRPVETRTPREIYLASLKFVSNHAPVEKRESSASRGNSGPKLAG
jgi:hypothetical protein